MNLEPLKFWIPVICFFLLSCLYWMKDREAERFYDVAVGAQAIARECIAHGQVQVDLFGAEINRALFLSRPSERRADQ